MSSPCETQVRMPASRRPHYQLDGADQAVAIFGLLLQLLAAFRRQLVEACLAIVFGNAPLGLQPALDEHAIERRVERPVLNNKVLARGVLDAFGDRVAV